MADKLPMVTPADWVAGVRQGQTLAAAGTHLILVARSEEKLRALTSQLADRHHIRAEVIVADQSQRELTATPILSNIRPLNFCYETSLLVEV